MRVWAACALAAAVAVRAAEPTPRPWPTYGPGEPREGEPVMPAVAADPADPAIQAEAKWAVDYLKTMSDSGIYATLELLRIVDAFTQAGVFHNNTLMTVVLGSPHLLEGTESTHQLIVMTDLRSGKRSAFAVDEFPAMQPGAVEEFWRAKVEAHRARREAVFAALEAGAAGGAQKQEPGAAVPAPPQPPLRDASGARLVEPKLPTVPDTVAAGAPPKQMLHHQPDQAVPEDTGTCVEPPPLDHSTHMALQEIARRAQQPGEGHSADSRKPRALLVVVLLEMASARALTAFLPANSRAVARLFHPAGYVPTAEDMQAILSFSGSGAARILPASVVPEPTPDPEKVREHKRRRKLQVGAATHSQQPARGAHAAASTTHAQLVVVLSRHCCPLLFCCLQKAMLTGQGTTDDAHDDHDDDPLPDIDPRGGGGELSIEVGEFNVGADGEITNTGNSGASAGALRMMEDALKRKAAVHKQRQQQEGAGKGSGEGKKRGGKGAVELSPEERDALLGS